MPQLFSAGSGSVPALEASFVPPALLRPLLLISDLDDTLIGGTPLLDEAERRGAAAECDARSAALKATFAHWRRLAAAGCGPPCRLAINTGR